MREPALSDEGRTALRWAATGLVRGLSDDLDTYMAADGSTTANAEQLLARSRLGDLTHAEARHLIVLNEDPMLCELAELSFDLNGPAAALQGPGMLYTERYDSTFGEGEKAAAMFDTLTGIQVRALTRLRVVLDATSDPLAYQRPPELR